MSKQSGLVPKWWKKEKVEDWLREDVPSFDIGGAVVTDRHVRSKLLAKSTNITLAGCEFFDAVFEEVGCSVEWKRTEGECVGGGECIAVVEGPACGLLSAERTGLEILIRCSSVATATKRAVDMLASASHLHTRVAGTRKTIPGLRLVDKLGLVVGGGDTHRMSLSHMVMLKDNHIDVCGSIENAVKSARNLCGFSSKIEVECRSLEEALEAAEAGADVLMMDNFKPKEMKEAAEAIKAKFPHVMVEASGGIGFDTLLDYASPYVDVVSMGCLTQSVNAVDMSLKIDKETLKKSL